MYTTCAYDFFHVYLQHPAMQLEACNSFEWKKNRFFLQKDAQVGAVHGHMASCQQSWWPWATLGHHGSPWVIIITTWNFPWFPYPASIILIHPIHPWQVGLGTCQWFRTGGPSSGAEDDSTSDRWRWIWARKVQRRQREIWMFGTVEGHDSSWCFKIVSLALAWVRLAAELFMVSIKVLSTSKQKFTPKARCVQSTVLAEPREDAGGGGDFAGRSSSMTGLGQSTLQVRHKLMYYSWTLHLQVTLQWNFAKKI